MCLSKNTTGPLFEVYFKVELLLQSKLKTLARCIKKPLHAHASKSPQLNVVHDQQQQSILTGYVPRSIKKQTNHNRRREKKYTINSMTRLLIKSS